MGSRCQYTRCKGMVLQLNWVGSWSHLLSHLGSGEHNAYLILGPQYVNMQPIRIETTITNHVRDFVSGLEKQKVVQIYHV